MRRFKHLYKDFSNFVLLRNLGTIRSSTNQYEGDVCTGSESYAKLLLVCCTPFPGFLQVEGDTCFFLQLPFVFVIFMYLEKISCIAVVVSVFCSSKFSVTYEM